MLYIQTAFLCEAKPLIELFNLRPSTGKMIFPTYGKDNIHLVISGLGKLRAAAATAYLATKTYIPHAVFFNIGIAGHASFCIGEGLFAGKILDLGSSTSFHPTFIAPVSQKVITVCTVDTAEKTFAHPYAYDMEASGFIQSALQFSSSELCHSYKVISDNLDGHYQLNPKQVEELIQKHTVIIHPFLSHLLQVSEELQERPHLSLAPFTTRRKISVTEQHQLTRLLNKLTLLRGTPIDAEEIELLIQEKDLFRALKHKIQSLPLRF